MPCCVVGWSTRACNVDICAQINPKHPSTPPCVNGSRKDHVDACLFCGFGGPLIERSGQDDLSLALERDEVCDGELLFFFTILTRGPRGQAWSLDSSLLAAGCMLAESIPQASCSRR
jgi:hypothetical protein